MTPKPAFQVGDYQFDPETGELTGRGSDEQTAITPLQPQPSQLLQMLIEAQPGMVTREEIQKSLWPGLAADYDRNLHFCIRKIRSAFGESATAPKYVETIPRRGYRLIAKVTPKLTSLPTDSMPVTDEIQSKESQLAYDELSTESNEWKSNGALETTKDPIVELGNCKKDISDNVKLGSSVRNPTLLVSLALLFVVGIASTLIQLNHSTPVQLESSMIGKSRSEKIRVAIMPFTSDSAGFKNLGSGEIGFGLLEQLSARMNKLDVIGPTTTDTIDEVGQAVQAFCQEFKIDILINGRYVNSGNDEHVLVEIIRVRDGKHIWVRPYRPGCSTDEIVGQTLTAFLGFVDDRI